MPYSNYTEMLLDLTDIIVTNVRKCSRDLTGAEGQPISVPAAAPRQTSSMTTEYGLSKIFLLWESILPFRKRHYACTACGKRIPEKASFLSRYKE